MVRGRPPRVATWVEHLDGSAEAKARLRALLEALGGRQTIQQASRVLGISARRLHAVRRELLEEMLDRLEPPRQPPPPCEPKCATCAWSCRRPASARRSPWPCRTF